MRLCFSSRQWLYISDDELNWIVIVIVFQITPKVLYLSIGVELNCDWGCISVHANGCVSEFKSWTRLWLKLYFSSRQWLCISDDELNWIVIEVLFQFTPRFLCEYYEWMKLWLMLYIFQFMPKVVYLSCMSVMGVGAIIVTMLDRSVQPLCFHFLTLYYLSILLLWLSYWIE